MKRIKILINLIAVLSFVTMAQVTSPFTIKSAIASKEGVAITNRAFSATTCDTTYAVNIKAINTAYVSMMTTDSATCLIKYQLSLDGTNWSALVTKDSIQQKTDTTTVKAVDMSTAILGMSYIRFVFQFDSQSNYMGSTSPRYWAVFKTKP